MSNLYNADEWKNLSDEELQIKVMELVRNAKKNPRYHTDLTFRQQIHELEERLDNYQESWGTEEVRDFYYDIEMDAMFKKLEETYALLRKNVLTAIVNSPEVQEFKNMALKMIEIEKENGHYDPDNWKDLEG